MSDDRIGAALASHAAAIGAFGVAAGVTKDGSHPTFGAWGIDGRNPETPMTPTGTFRIGSVTKTFTAAIVLGLIDRGELRLDDTIEQWLPDYPYAPQMSIRSLLTHTAGTADSTADAFPEYIELLLTDLSRTFAPTEVIELMAALPPHATPDASYRYSNTDYQILGAIAERVSARPFAVLIQDLATRLDLGHTAYDARIPADLKHAWFDIESVGTADATPQRDQDANDFPNEALITTAYAAGGMTSSLTDLLAWGNALYLGDALSPSMRDQLRASPSVEDPDTGRGHGFGVAGYGTLTADGSWSAYGHEGNIAGSSAFVASFPDSRTTVAIHANVQEVSTEAFIDLAFDLERNTR